MQQATATTQTPESTTPPPQRSVRQCAFDPSLVQGWLEAFHQWQDVIGRPRMTYDQAMTHFEEGWPSWISNWKNMTPEQIAALGAQNARYADSQRVHPTPQGPYIMMEDKVRQNRADCEARLN